ncbi:MAG: hypothetical protein RLZZ303_3773 [Candidatus Hydrogenedentota bacterium]|jgi:uncharacterized GH25 family protein
MKAWILTVAILLAGTAHAHGFWVNLSQYAIDLENPSHGSPGLRAFIGFGHYYPSDEPVKLEEVTRYELVKPGGERSALRPLGAGYLVAEVKPEQAGPHVVAARYYSHFFTMYKENGETKYATEPKSGIENVRLSHHYDVFGKALLAVGDTAEGDFTQPLGDDFEIVPQRNPRSLAGVPAEQRALTVTVLHKGQPALGADIRATYLGYSSKGDFAVETQTNESGEAVIPLKHPGPWVVLAHKAEPATGDMAEKTDEMHYEASLTFSVE